jgi:hypothetical protein
VVFRINTATELASAASSVPDFTTLKISQPNTETSSGHRKFCQIQQRETILLLLSADCMAKETPMWFFELHFRALPEEDCSCTRRMGADVRPAWTGCCFRSISIISLGFCECKFWSRELLDVPEYKGVECGD